MNRTLIGLAAVAAGAGVVIGRWVMRRPMTVAVRHDGRDRWHSVTINCAPQQLGPKPPPLDELPFPVEVRIRPAPGDRGTELAARLMEPSAAGSQGEDPVRRLRRALREARSIAEIGEVLLPDWPPTTHRTPTGAPLAYATRHAREEGRL